MSKFFETFDKKRFIIVTQLIFVLLCLFVIVNIIGRTHARYESDVDISAEAAVAFFVVNQGTYENTIALHGLTPSPDPFYYTFYVANFKNDKRTNTNLEYDIKFETTTNLPLTYEIIRNQSFNGTYTSIIDNMYVRQDENDVYYRVMECDDTFNFTHTTSQIDQYTLRVNFSEQYKNDPDSYQGMIELFSIIIDARQVA